MPVETAQSICEFDSSYLFNIGVQKVSALACCRSSVFNLRQVCARNSTVFLYLVAWRVCGLSL